MLEHILLRDKGILLLRPKGPLKAVDFAAVAREVDPYLAAQGPLHGILLEAAVFPGWSDVAAFLAHIRFVRGHHRRIRRIAVLTDSGFLTLMPRIATRFMGPDVRRFRPSDREAALDWLQSAPLTGIRMTNSPDSRLIVLEASGKVARADVESLVPELECRMAGGATCFLVDLSRSEGVEWSALWEDARFELRHLREIRRVALFGDQPWLQTVPWLAHRMTPIEVRVFRAGWEDDAWAWLKEAAGWERPPLRKSA